MKHAILIIADNKFEISAKTIELLDDQDIDFYIHIDKKAKNFDHNLLDKAIKKSHIYYIDRLNVYWGSYTLIDCTLRLLEASAKNKYDYYHLISDSDLPIKTKDYFKDFFNKNKGYEFVGIEQPKIKEKRLNRIKYHYLMDFKNNKIRYLFEFVPKVESFFGVNRIKDSKLEFQYGSNWFSITHDFAIYLLNNEELINKTFKNAYCADELFVQTLLFNSKYKDKMYRGESELYLNNMRKIDWKRGKPYVWQTSDFDELMSSNCLFARKFDLDTDKDIIDKIYNALKNN